MNFKQHYSDMKHFYHFAFVIFSVVFLSFSTQVTAQGGNTCSTAIPLDVNLNECTYTTVSNEGLTHSTTTPTGCVGFAGGDLWLSLEIPESGEVYVTSEFLPGSSLLLDINMAMWSGTCGALVQEGCDADSGSGFYPAATLTGAPGSTMYIQLWESGNDAHSTFSICANGTPMCDIPEATYTRECLGENLYEVTVNLTSLGDAGEVNIINDAGVPAFNGITSPGVFVLEPIALGQEVNITIEHLADNICNKIITVSDHGLSCVNLISCGTPLNVEYCYGNYENAEFIYTSVDGSPLTITFNAGDFAEFDDKIIIRDGVDDTGPLLYQGAHDGDFTGLTRTAPSGSIYFNLLSDVGGSCYDGSLGITLPLNYDIACAVESTPSCEDAVELTSKTSFAASEINADLSGVQFSGANQCEGPGDNPDLFFKFTAVGSVTYFRVEAVPGFDPVVEVFEGCGEAQLACMNEAGVGERELFWLTDLTIGEEYVYRVYHAGADTPPTMAFETAIAHIPVVQIRAADCGTMDLKANSIIRSTTPNPNYLVDGFIWEFTELEEPYNVYEMNSPNGANPQFRMFWFADYEYGRTYSVRIKARMFQGPNVGEYGPACTIGFAEAVGSALQQTYHDGFFQLCDIVKAVPVPGTENYRWTFTEGGNTVEYNSNSSNYFCPLQNVNGLELAKTYEVKVYTTHNGEESTSSIERTINMVASVANTGINPSFISCGSTVKLPQWTQAYNVCAANSFTFRFKNVTQPEEPVIEITRPTRVLVFSMAPGLIPGDTYSVAVKAAAGGQEGDYTAECEFTIFDPNAIDEGEGEGEFTGTQQSTTSKAVNNEDIAGNSQLSIYPNPVTVGDEISIEISEISDAQQDVHVEIYDINGKLMQQQRFGNNGDTFNGKIKLEQKLSTGVYILNTLVNGKYQGSQKLIIE